MSMTRRDFEAIAAVLRTSNDYLDRGERARLAGEFADVLEATNPRFDRYRFLDATEPVNIPRRIDGTYSDQHDGMHDAETRTAND